MRRSWIVVLMLAISTVIALPLLANQSASAEDGVDPPQVAMMIIDGVLKSDLSANSAVEPVTHNLCGIGLGGYCPGRYRSCIRSGTPKAECDAWVTRCDACNEAMVHCRQRVGHVPGYTCAKCRKALDRCRAHLLITTK